MKMTVYLLLILFANSSTINANDGFASYSPLAGSLVGAETEDIQMVSEIVRYYASEQKYRTEFVFRNITEESQEFSTVFPIYTDEFSERYFDPNEFNFKTWINDSAAKSRYSLSAIPNLRQREFDSFVTEGILIGPGEEILVVHEYNDGPAIIRGSNVGESSFSYHYVARTGKSWAGTIETGRFEFILPINTITSINSLDDSYIGLSEWQGIVRVESQYYPLNPNVTQHNNELRVVWDLTDYDPDFDIQIKMDIYGTPSAMTSPDRAGRYIGEPSTEIVELIEYDLNKFNMAEEEYLKHVHQWIEYQYNLYKEGQYKDDISKMLAACQLYINFKYALKGYQFSSDNWLAGFNSFSWYSPKAGLHPQFSSKESEELKIIIDIRTELSLAD